MTCSLMTSASFQAAWVLLVKTFKYKQLLLSIKNAKRNIRITGAKAIL